MRHNLISSTLRNIVAIVFATLLIAFSACKRSSKTSENNTGDADSLVAKGPVLPEWAKSASIYEVNIRQYTPEGNFKAFENHLPRLQELGADILWLMPIFPVGEKNRKGTLGSYYAVKDYKDVNPDYGTKEDFKALVIKAHSMGMYVILDWVANHTSWDNSLIDEHPDWYTRDSVGVITTPVEDWSDVADLNYDNPELRNYMSEALAYWVKEFDVDGFRCDVAGMVPLDFWNDTRFRLDSIKPVFMLAEWEDPALLEKAFNMDYAWDLHHLMNEIAQGKKNVTDLDSFIVHPTKEYPPYAIRMNFITNHDENSWNGTIWERMGDATPAMAVLSATVPGMPLIYSGQEAGLDKRLSFFDKDEIDWKEHEMGILYKTLFKLKKNNQALWNGQFGGPMKRIGTSAGSSIFAFLREKGADKVFVVINLSPTEQKFTFNEKCYCDKYTDVFTGKSFEIVDEIGMSLGPWEYSICEKH
ncbi:MAG: alpha-glucosidase C-terminal domain-containing protein [Bacteroidales bacterium]|nr:alpha-glucosidase C-terminal domain-containing protein [Bacteroidales bacterium]MCF8457207.1 alpha-glucosidase C-terminal domain-containing protein [Bacteroidales bacterium]